MCCVSLCVCVCVCEIKSEYQQKKYVSDLSNFIVCTPTHVSAGGEGEVEPLTKFSKKKGGGLDRISIFIGGCWERGGD